MMNEPLILVVEDLEDDFLLLARAFRKAGVHAKLHWVRNGDEAIRFLSKGLSSASEAQPVVSLILSDLHMPQSDGFHLMSWIRGKPALKRIPIVVLTSSAQSPDISRAYDLGANSYLVKPTCFDDLVKISSALREYWMRFNQQPHANFRPDSRLDSQRADL
jgi:CheY-like chemotaxis protein